MLKNLFQRTHYYMAEPGTDPLQAPLDVRKKRKLGITEMFWGLIALGVIGSIAYAMMASKTAAAAPSPTETPMVLTQTLTPTTSKTPTATGTVAMLPSASASAAPTFPYATQTPWMVTQQVTRVVQVNVPGPVQVVTVMVVNQIIREIPADTSTPLPSLTPWPTYTEGPTQTPWYITVVVEVTSTPTDIPTHTPTPSPTDIPTLEVTATP